MRGKGKGSVVGGEWSRDWEVFGGWRKVRMGKRGDLGNFGGRVSG